MDLGDMLKWIAVGIVLFGIAYVLSDNFKKALDNWVKNTFGYDLANSPIGKWSEITNQKLKFFLDKMELNREGSNIFKVVFNTKSMLTDLVSGLVINNGKPVMSIINGAVRRFTSTVMNQNTGNPITPTFYETANNQFFMEKIQENFQVINTNTGRVIQEFVDNYDGIPESVRKKIRNDDINIET